MKKRTIAMIVSLVLAMAMGLGGTLAYLTDRDSDVNVFTIGNVDIELTEKFEQGIELIPGVNIEKTPTIRNTGNHAAWVWMTWSIPAALDNAVQGTEIGSDANIIHWNPLGATTDGYVDDTRVNNAIAKGLLPEGITADQIKENKMTWNVFNSLGEGVNMIRDVEIDGKKYNTYVLLYNKALTPGEETLPSVYNVFLDARVDVDPEGNMFLVDKGVVTPVAWNIKEDKNPKIYVAAYAIQTEGFADVKEAYAGYAAQWGANGGVTYEEPAFVTSADELQVALDNATDGDVITLGADIKGDVTVAQKPNIKVTINGNNKEFDGTITVDGKSSRYETAGVTIKNVKFTSADITKDAFINLGASGNNNTRYTNNVTVDNCTFNTTSTADVVAVKSYTGGDWNLTVKNCTVGAGMHSMLQVTNVEKGLTVTGCKVNSKNGINLNNTPSLEMNDCIFDTKGYCVRVGVNGSDNTDVKTFNIKDCSLTSANDDGDAVIIFRDSATYANVDLAGTTLNATEKISGNTTQTTIVNNNN